MSKVKIEIEDDGRVMVYVDEKLVPALVDIDFANVRDGYKAAVLVVGKGDPRAEATIDALLEANGTRVVNPLYVEEGEYEEAQMDHVRKRMTEEMRKEAEPTRIKMEEVPDLVAWKKQVAEAVAKIKEDPTYSPIFAQPPEAPALGRWTRAFPGQGVNRVRGRLRHGVLLDEVSTPAERQRARELLSEESAKGPFTFTPIAPKVPGPYSDTGTRPMPQEKQVVNLPLLEKHISFANDGTKGLLTHFTLNGLKIEDVTFVDTDTSGPYKRIAVVVPPGDPRIPGIMTVVYEGEICLLTFKSHPVSQVATAHWLDRVTEESRRRFQDELKAEIQKLKETKVGLEEALKGVLPHKRVLTVHRDTNLRIYLDGVTQYQAGYKVDTAPGGLVWTFYLTDDDPRIGQPDEDILYEGKPAKLRYAGNVTKKKGTPPAPAVVESPATDPYLSQLRQPLDHETPVLTFDFVDGNPVPSIEGNRVQGLFGMHEEETGAGPLFLFYVAETDKRLGMPITLVRYQDKPALVVCATKRS